MFTGIVEAIGRVRRLVRRKTNQIFVETALACKPGDSIAVQGTCLTVIRIETKGIWVETMPQTRAATTLDRIKTGDPVNLERALAMNGRVGGHFVLGHVDEIGVLIKRKSNEFFIRYDDTDNCRLLVNKGSIAINGVSLTVGNIGREIFSVNLIPYTLSATTLGMLKPGDKVNIEYDYLAKITLAGAKKK